MTGEEMKTGEKMAERDARKKLKNLNMSSEETKKMAAMMKDPKFKEMFVEYAQEISDPKNRQEMETALKEAENRGERVPGFPEDKELLIPYAAFCAKTKNEKTGTKVWTEREVCIKRKLEVV